MTDLLHDVDAPSDAELISRVRGGDVAAYGELFARHVDAAKRLSRQLVRGPDADDLVSEAFAKVLTVLQGGGGPDVAFRAYLLTSVRRLHVDRIRSGSRLQTSDDMEAFDPGVPFQDTAVAAFESGAAAKAFASLPERWQLVLWHLEVEGQKPADVAPLLGMSPNSVSALAYRAREGLRQAFLTMHLSDISETDCRWVNEHLGAYVRNGLAKRESTKVQAHLDECRRCTAMYLELTEVNSNLRAIIGPLLLGAAATGYLASSGTAAGGVGVMAAFGRVRDTISANAGAATAGAVAAGVAAIATAGIMLLPSSGPDTVVGADEPIGTVSTPPGAPGGSDSPKPDNGRTTGPSASAAAEEASPAAILPSELPSPTETPAVQVVQGSTDPTTGTDPGGTDAGGGSTSPTEPTATEPGPTEPSPTEPSPTEPSPTQPSPTQPSPTQPSPTEPSPTEPSPTNPPPVTYKVVAGPASIENGQVSFDVTGDPELPPTLSLDLQSQPAGVTFGSDGTCKVRAGDATLADCDTTPLTALAAVPFARTLLAESLQSFLVTMPLAGSPTVDTVVTITLRDDKGVQLAQTQGLYDVKETEPDLSLTGFPTTVSPTNVHDYLVAGSLGVTGYTGDVTLTIADAGGRARFAEGGVPGCTTKSPTSVLCPASVAGALTLPLYVQDNRTEDTSVTITVARADGVTDSDTTNDSVTVVLERYRPTPVDAAVDASAPVRGNSGKAEVTVVVTTSLAALPVTLTATYDPLITPAPDGCTATTSGAACALTGGKTLVFEVDVERIRNEPQAGDLGFAVTVPETFEDTDSTNNTDLVTVLRFEEGVATDPLPETLQRTTTSTSEPTRAQDGVTEAAGPTTDPARAVEKATKTANQLLHLRDQQDAGSATDQAKATKKAGAAADKGAQGQATKAEAKKPAADKGQAAASKGAKPDNGKGDAKAADAPEADAGQGSGNQGSGDQGGGPSTSGKKEPNAVEQVIAAVVDLLP